ncbi:hypothetical protein BH10CYA1_BH10CYA1_55240 [soil metagenome]
MTKSYRLGDFCFELKSANTELSNCIGSLLEKYNIDVDKNPLSLIDIDLPLEIVAGWDEVVSEASGLEIVRLIVRRALNHHHDYLWFDAATLVSPHGKVVLIVGASHSGKSTAATALAFGCSWKILAEDVSLVDPKTRTIKTFASPISLRTGSLERIQRATGVLPGPVIASEWVPINDHLNKEIVDFKVDLAIELAVTDPRADQPMSVTRVSAQTFIHTLLPLCNAIHLDNGIELLDDGLKYSTCFRISGGSLSQRLEFITSQTNENVTTIEGKAEQP